MKIIKAAIVSIVMAAVIGCAGMAMQMSEEQKLYLSKCASCHQPIAAGRYNDLQWEQNVARYGQDLTPAKKQQILNYLQNAN
jgi:mono/diheme cytochrome c family protein